MTEQVTSTNIIHIGSSDFDDICRTCFKPGKVKVDEELPYGQAMSCIHDDGEKHAWTKYTSLASIGQRGLLSKTGKPVTIVCPKCEKKGTVNFYRPDTERTDKFSYVVRHERIKGTWGKTKIRRVRRCYIQDKEQKEQVKNQLDSKRGRRN